MENYLKDKQIIISTEEYKSLKETEKEYFNIFLNAKKNEKNIVVEEIETLFLLNGFFNWLFPSSPRTIKVTRPQVITGEENIRKYFLEQFNEHAKYKEKYEFLKASFNEETTKQLDEMKSKYWLIRKFKF